MKMKRDAKPGGCWSWERGDTDTICATCANLVELTHMSPYGELICTECAEADDWQADGLPLPTPITGGRKMKLRRKSTTVYLDLRDFAELRRLSLTTGIPMSVIIRRGVQMAIADMVGRESANGGMK